MNRGDREQIPNYLALATLATVLCCPATGIVALVHAAKVSSYLEAGDLEAARAASRKARRWAWASVWLGLAMILLTIAGGVGIGLYLIQLYA
ncbi:MAG: CD225/dispanin family protein [Isosphaeraceae bacterium]|nr:CD225/dispanin family protein [Isosphaeraceae bacterium]